MAREGSAAGIRAVRELLARQGREDLLAELGEIEARLAAGRLSVALIGQFKRGKTSLLNALLGEDILPTGVLPLTAVVTHVRPGPALRVTVRCLDGTEQDIAPADVALYASEQGNPRNVRGVRDILVEHPSPLLRSGIELVDTPGIGSVWAHQTEVAVGYLPWVDVALFVVSPDPPITAVEREFLAEAKAHAGKIVLVLTKSDLVPAAELEAVRAFVQGVVEEALGRSAPLFTLCTLAGRASGTAGLAAYLADLAAGEGDAVAGSAADRRLGRLLERLRFTWDLRRAACATPDILRRERLAAVERQLAAYDAALAAYRGAWTAAFKGVQAAFDEHLAGRKAEILGELRPELEQALGGPGHPRTVYVEAAARLTALAQARLEELRDDLRGVTRDVLRAAAEPLVGQLQDYLARAASAAADLFDLPAVPLDLPTAVHESRGFHFKWQDDPSILPNLGVPAGVVLVPHGRAAREARRLLTERTTAFVDRNFGRLHFHFLEAMKQEWRDLWSRLDVAALSFAEQLKGAAHLLGEQGGSLEAELALCDDALRDVARVAAGLPHDPDGR